ncbi:thioredoxin family protein [Ferrimonas sediminicola]|uniref:Thioredoxin family protein n=1 Tax=Ferrimonas sediminicola TaxID=2569538 RepID=A0A4U1BLZ6_9GAMM|nr:thioredoxin family protein [Ferrimonas sediminicola]TKB51138.1 thioredoxin family protein [Ferrimonas sediminicola]
MKKTTLLAMMLAPALMNTPAMANSGCGFEEGQKGPFATCSQEEKQEVILTGELAMADIMEAIPGYGENFDRYAPQAEWVDALKMVETPTEIVVIIGTWCPDCHRETPRFAKLLEQVNNDKLTVRYIGVDRQKSDPDKLAAAYDFQRIPTFMVIQQGKEIGRIVETPSHSLEQDLAEILK